jgi:anti-sigma factor RsiW
MVVSCEQVWREISNYLEGEVDTGLRAAMEDHLRGCKHCTAVVDGTRNVVQLYGDERLFEVRLGFSHRLHRRLEENMPGNRRCFLGGMVAAAAAVLVAGRFEVAGSSVSRRAELRSEFAQPGAGVPPDMWVIVSGVGKLFTQLGVPSSTTKPVFRQSTRETLRRGYGPCVRCMKKYPTA